MKLPPSVTLEAFDATKLSKLCQMTAHQYQNTSPGIAQQRAATKIQTAFRRVDLCESDYSLKINIIAGVINDIKYIDYASSICRMLSIQIILIIPFFFLSFAIVFLTIVFIIVPNA